MFAGAHSRQTREDEDAHLSPAREMSNQGVNPVALGALLVVQNAGAVLLMRYTRSIPGETEFNTQTAVIMQEVLKGLTCVVILLATEGTVASAWAKPVEALKTAVPALLYLLQNNLQYVAVGYLDAATYTVSYQTKTIWSGILSMVLLNRTLGPNKWLGIISLSIGVATVQVAGMAREEEEGGGALEPEELPGGLGGRMFGLAVVLFAAAVSSCAGVYFEKILKGVKVSLWTRNLQLAGYSVVVGLVKLMLSDDGAVMRVNGNFFMGYTPMTHRHQVRRRGAQGRRARRVDRRLEPRLDAPLPRLRAHAALLLGRRARHLRRLPVRRPRQVLRARRHARGQGAGQAQRGRGRERRAAAAREGAAGREDLSA